MKTGEQISDCDRNYAFNDRQRTTEGGSVKCRWVKNESLPRAIAAFLHFRCGDRQDFARPPRAKAWLPGCLAIGGASEPHHEQGRAFT